MLVRLSENVRTSKSPQDQALQRAETSITSGVEHALRRVTCPVHGETVQEAVIAGFRGRQLEIELETCCDELERLAHPRAEAAAKDALRRVLGV